MSCDAVDFVNRMIGRPYEPTRLHCWELTRQCQHEVFGRELPIVLAAPQSKRELIGMMAERDRHDDWCEVAGPAHGAVVFIGRESLGRVRAAIHAGVFLALDGGGVLHTDDPHGVAFESLAVLAARGWAAPSYYLPAR
ncbi:hypothetical protein SAMN04515666_11915 [Bosea lupini]|uniref:NlpC/P60 family protein n=1 Tax=Bosea lupini TaxID=1036779 RepID=A0A1H8ADY2_9HYPH|nr:hypothetical protein [Bosea lupini]SEM68696.1 hypothetical protein SAMN04515666_11915 [Bosea lupini]